MSTTKDGGPAFPVPDTYHPNGQIEYGATGMSLRDWFAGQALAALLSESGRYDSTGAALDAYCFADAMISARERGVEVKQGGEYRPHEELPDEHWHKIQTRPSLSWHPERGWEAACEMRGKMMYGKGKTIAQAQAALRAEWEGGGQ